MNDIKLTVRMKVIESLRGERIPDDDKLRLVCIKGSGSLMPIVLQYLDDNNVWVDLDVDMSKRHCD